MIPTTNILSTTLSRSLCHAPRSVNSPLIMPPQLGIQSMTLKTMPSVAAHSGTDVYWRWCGPAQM